MTAQNNKHCRYCNQYRPISDFITSVKWVNGAKVRHDKCIKCAAEVRKVHAHI